MSEKTINCERDGYVPSYDAALYLGIAKSTFIYRARKLGVRYKIGTRIWDGYTWNVEDINRLMLLTP